MRMIRGIVILFFALTLAGTAVAERGSFVKSIPSAIPSKNLFQVSITRVDGDQPSTFSTNIPVEPGTHKLAVRIEAAYGLTDLKQVREVSKEMTLQVEAGATYLIAGEINPDATTDQQRAGDYWKPVVHQVVK